MIELNTEITIEPIAPKTFDGVWIQNLTINSPNPGQCVESYIKVCPFNSTTGELLETNSQMIIISDVMTEVKSNSTMAQAMGAIFVAVENLIKTRKTFGE